MTYRSDQRLVVDLSISQLHFQILAVLHNARTQLHTTNECVAPLLQRSVDFVQRLHLFLQGIADHALFLSTLLRSLDIVPFMGKLSLGFAYIRLKLLAHALGVAFCGLL